MAGGGGGVTGGGGIRRAYAKAAGRAVCGARIQSARAPEKHPPELGISLPRLGFRLLKRDTMVVLRSSLELHSHSTISSATDSLDLSSEFLSLEHSGRRRPSLARAAGKSTVPKAEAAGVSTGLGRGTLGPGWRRAEGTRAPHWVDGPSRASEVEGSGETDLGGSGLSSWSPPLSTQEETKSRSAA